MSKFILFILLFVSSYVHAGTCEDRLTPILASVTVDVVKMLKLDPHCERALYVGTDGKPQCYDLASILRIEDSFGRVMTQAQAVCEDACRWEKKRLTCYQLVSRSNLRKVGLNGVRSQLRNKLAPSDPFMPGSWPSNAQ